MHVTDLKSHPPAGESEGCFVVPASFAQQRLWFLDRFEPDMPAYNIPVAWRMRGRLDVFALQRALDEIVRRHEILRTSFDWDDGLPVQVIAESAKLSLNRIDLPPGDSVEERIQDLVQNQSERRFDLATGPLARVCLVHLGARDHVLMLTMHHIISDLGSLGVFAQELASIYGAYIVGKESPLPELPIQYADYAEWQRNQLKSERLDRHLVYWRQYLDGAPTSLDLLYDRPRPQNSNFPGGWVDIVLDRQQTTALRRLTRHLGATLFMTVAAVFNVLLYRYTGQRDLLIGYPISGRNRPEVEGLIGLFLNTLVLRSRLAPSMDFPEVVGQIRDSVLESHEHQHLPFERLVEDLVSERDTSHHPLFQVAYSLVGVDDNLLELPGLDLQWVQTDRRAAKFDLTLSFSESSVGDIRGGFEYNKDLFDEETVERFAGHFKTMLASVLEDPGAPVGRLPLLPPDERRKVLTEWSRGQSSGATGSCVHQLVEQQAAERPHAVAVDDGRCQLTYSVLNEKANRLAHRLGELGVRLDDRVGLCVSRSAAMVVGMLGILKAGGAYVPLQADEPERRLRRLLADASATVLVTERGCAPSLLEQEVLLLPVDESDQSGNNPSAANPCVRIEPANLAYCISTSGSTGTPKLVAASHEGLANLIAWHHRRYESGQADRVMQVASVSFDACTWEVWSALCSGGRLFIMADDIRMSAERLIEVLSEKAISHCFLPTPLAESVLTVRRPPRLALKVMYTGGDLLRRGAGRDSSFELVNHYGPTECSVVATSCVVNAEPTRAPPIGSPIAGVLVYILDAWGEPVPIGVAGELHIGGIGLARGYLDRPALTAQNFAPDPFNGVPGARMYRTGDIARHLASGDIEFMGRVDQQIKLRGFRIELAEIEMELARHPSVRACTVSAVELAVTEKQLVAYVESDTTDDDAADLWRRHLKTRLPAYMIPSAFVRMNRLPVLPSGKIDRGALPQPGRQDYCSTAGYEPPGNEAEVRLAGIWSELLGVDRVGLRDDFFSLGGQSLLAIELVSRIRTTFGVELSVRDVFEHPTIAGLADTVDSLRWIARGRPEAPTNPEDRETGEI